MHAKETWNIAFVSYLASQVITRWNLKWEVINFPTAFDVNWRLSIATDCVTFFARNVIPYNRGTKAFPLIKNQHYPSPSTKLSASYLIRFSTISNAKRRWKQENRAILTRGKYRERRQPIDEKCWPMTRHTVRTKIGVEYVGALKTIV